MKNAPIRHSGVGAPNQRITNRSAIMESGVSFQKTEQRLTRKGFTCWKSKTNSGYRLPVGGRDLDLTGLSVKSCESVFLRDFEKTENPGRFRSGSGNIRQRHDGRRTERQNDKQRHTPNQINNHNLLPCKQSLKGIFAAKFESVLTRRLMPLTALTHYLKKRFDPF